MLAKHSNLQKNDSVWLWKIISIQIYVDLISIKYACIVFQEMSFVKNTIFSLFPLVFSDSEDYNNCKHVVLEVREYHSS